MTWFSFSKELKKKKRKFARYRTAKSVCKVKSGKIGKKKEEKKKEKKK